MRQANGSAHVADRSVSVVFLAGGTGKRMGVRTYIRFAAVLCEGRLSTVTLTAGINAKAVFAIAWSTHSHA